MVYRPTFRKQLDGTRCGGYNCACASHAMAADRHRRGIDPSNSHGWKPTPKEIRAHITPYTCRGTTMPENQRAVAHCYGVPMTIRYQIPWDSFRSLIISGRGAVVPIQYSALPPQYRGSRIFTGAHSIYVNERRASDGAYLVYDPLADGRYAGCPKGPRWWPGPVLRRAAEAFPGTNPGCIHASLTRDTEP